MAVVNTNPKTILPDRIVDAVNKANLKQPVNTGMDYIGFFLPSIRFCNTIHAFFFERKVSRFGKERCQDPFVRRF
jgi:hypothetical protein